VAVNLNDLARVELVDKLAAKVAAKLNTLTDTTFKAAKVDGNTLKFYTSIDTTGQTAETIDIPAEQFLDQVSTSFVPNFQFSALLYDGASNPNLDGKAVLVLGLKTKSNDGKSESISYSFVDVSRLVDTYTASDTSVTVTNYKIKANISADAGNTLKLKSNGLYAAGVTDTATTTAAGLMSAADKTKVNNLDVELSKKLDSDATAVKATKLEIARSLKVSLSSSAAQTFDGSSDAAQIGVAGILPVANGGTGQNNLSNVTVGKATQLETARNIQTNLASTTAGSFNGTASVSAGVTGTLGIANGGTGQTTAAGVRNALGLGNTTGAVPIANGGTGLTSSPSMLTNLATTNAANVLQASPRPGVTGTLPVANGGTGQTSLANVTVGAATKATQDGAGNVITDTYVTKTTFEETIDNIRKWRKIPIYGYRIDKNEADPDTRVEYILDAAGMVPASYGDNSDPSTFNYGSWKDVWFMQRCKPLMLKSDGTVDYYLDPDDYTKKADGTASDVANTSYDGNAMVQIPLCWVYRYEDENYYYEIVSPEKVDETFKAYAHTDASGNIKDYFYLGMYAAGGDTTKMRSLAGQTELHASFAQTFSATRANGTGWSSPSWMQRSLLTTLNTLIHRTVLPGFGYTGVENKGFHLFRQCEWVYCEGFINNAGNWYIKLTPEGAGYQLGSTTGYTFIKTYRAKASGHSRYLSLNEYGYVANEVKDYGNPYYFRGFWVVSYLDFYYCRTLSLYAVDLTAGANSTLQYAYSRLAYV